MSESITRLLKDQFDSKTIDIKPLWSDALAEGDAKNADALDKEGLTNAGTFQVKDRDWELQAISTKGRLRKAVLKVIAKLQWEKDSMKRLMTGRDTSSVSIFEWYITPSSWKYTMLRYARAVCIFANFVIIPIL
jgi:hypothetical protein